MAAHPFYFEFGTKPWRIKFAVEMIQTKRKFYPMLTLFGTAVFLFAGCTSSSSEKPMNDSDLQKPNKNYAPGETDTAVFASGCFWCTEAIFQRVEGVDTVISGYAGSKIKTPTYKEVCSGLTGAAEAVQVVFHPAKISYDDLLLIFFKTHDPTTLNKQGADAGTQYRSAIFYRSEEQKNIAEHYKKKIDSSGYYKNPVVTEIVAFTNFFNAEEYHQDYFNLNKEQPYCEYVIQPKIEKLEALFPNKLKYKVGE